MADRKEKPVIQDEEAMTKMILGEERSRNRGGEGGL